MMEFLNFTFTNGWHFFGVLLLIGAVLNGIAAIIKSARTIHCDCDD